MNYNYNQHINHISNSNLSNTVNVNGSILNASQTQNDFSATQTTATAVTFATTTTTVMPSTLFKFNPYEKLEISLNSGLPNEIDFVFNTIVLLSSDESHSFRIYTSPRLVQLILAHIGFFGIEDKYNYRHMYDNVWNSFAHDELFAQYGGDLDNINDRMINKLKCKPRRNFVRFWHNAVKFPERYSSFNLDYTDLFNELLPKLYNDCKFFFLFLF